MPSDLMAVFGCPFCRGPLFEEDEKSPVLLVCRACGLAFPVSDGIPDLLPKSARLILS
ncbi:MAG: Trm112 family protein [Deltaproteobacteria bacterium]|nr:Trm112 family protein [Deltaproteobacteria bacterium]